MRKESKQNNIRKRKLRLKKKFHKQKLEKEAIELWKQACLKKYGDRSEVSGKPISTFHHFIPKGRNGLLKFDVENGVGLTAKEHYNIHFSSNPVVIHDLVEVIEHKRGEKWRKYINEKQEENRNSGGYKSIKWYEEQICKLKELL